MHLFNDNRVEEGVEHGVDVLSEHNEGRRGRLIFGAGGGDPEYYYANVPAGGKTMEVNDNFCLSEISFVQINQNHIKYISIFHSDFFNVMD